MTPSTDATTWKFWIDRGGTFTDIVALSSAGVSRTLKLLSENPDHYEDAAIEGIRRCLKLKSHETIPPEKVSEVKMGSTVATNALLEKKGAKTLWIVTKGFRDALRIGDQSRPRLFDLKAQRHTPLYHEVLEVHERLNASGEILQPLFKEEKHLKSFIQQLNEARKRGCTSIAISLMHSYLNPVHEKLLLEHCQNMGFSQISCSHEVSPLIKFIPRSDTTLVDAYLTPVLKNYVQKVEKHLQGIPLSFMQSNGGLTHASNFSGKDAVLSGPAGGMVGAAKTAEQLGIQKIITFDMGGTSTDVAHYAGIYERSYDTVVNGTPMRVPMMDIHTVAAGGGSICRFDGSKLVVGPESAGAQPGPKAYGNQGPLTITDCNLFLGRLQVEYFPKVFGFQQNEGLDLQGVQNSFQTLIETMDAQGEPLSAEECARGFLNIAVQNMASAIKKISIERGHDVSKYSLQCFGGAGGQHACLVAEALDMSRIIIHPYAGVLSAYGMGLASSTKIDSLSHSLELDLKQSQQIDDDLKSVFKEMTHRQQLKWQQEKAQSHLQIELLQWVYKVELLYKGSSQSLSVDWDTPESMIHHFEKEHKKRYGFTKAHSIIMVETLVLESSISPDIPELNHQHPQNPAQTMTHHQVYFDSQWQNTPFFRRQDFAKGQTIIGPAIILEDTGTIVLEPRWQATMNRGGSLILTRNPEARLIEDDVESGAHSQPNLSLQSRTRNPILLEVFNNLFMSIAEQMGGTLQQTALSVNIKERLDYSCAIFTANGDLISNAPHMPVHLGSMGESVKAIISTSQLDICEGDAIIINDPFQGGTHIPDVTIVSPLCVNGKCLFFVASRGHHADMGGITPGSMPSHSTSILEEGIIIPPTKLISKGVWQDKKIRELLCHNPCPVRNIEQNLADFKAQCAANLKGLHELNRIGEHYGWNIVKEYALHIQDNAEEAVRRVLKQQKSGKHELNMDNGSRICVEIKIDASLGEADINFHGTSPQSNDNFNAPKAICRAAVLYVLRSLISEDIPLNDGCLRPVNIVTNEASLISPKYPAAVVAGNVETSQCITNALLGALGAQAASQGTMNNLTFGNEDYQYYETICGGCGAGPDFQGASGVQSHMTNSRLTDPEVLELRYPVLLEHFKLREGSGGQGQFKGGEGVERCIKFLKKMELNLLSNNRKNQPFGLKGGQAGASGEQWITKESGEKVLLKACDKHSMQEGDRFTLKSPGGGGYGINPSRK